jgi:hypothetical protein
MPRIRWTVLGDIEGNLGELTFARKILKFLSKAFWTHMFDW